MSWRYDCGFCDWYIMVSDRGGHGRDQGAGVEAANLMQAHVAQYHSREAQ